MCKNVQNRLCPVRCALFSQMRVFQETSMIKSGFMNNITCWFFMGSKWGPRTIVDELPGDWNCKKGASIVLDRKEQ